MQREGFWSQEDGAGAVEADSGRPQQEAGPLRYAPGRVTRGPCIPAVSRLPFISPPQPQFMSGRG